jgi:two-component system, response regulator / RNA-binding antiterminator
MTSPQTPASSGSSLTSPSEAQEVEPVSAQGAVVPAAPLSVLLIDEDPERARVVEAGLVANAIVHTATQTHGRVLLDLIARISPDVIIMDCNSPDRDTIESLRLVARSNPKPIVMFVEEEGGDGMQEAINAGVSAYVIDGLTPKRVQPLIDTAIARFRHMDGLRNELKKTKDDLAARKVIERAKGMLMQHHGMTEDQAFSSIRTMSQQQGKPIKEVAENILTIVGMLAGNSAPDKT